MHSPYPFWQQFLIILIGAPVISLVFGVLARGWTNTVQGGTASKATVARQRKLVLAMMGAAWIVGFGEMIVFHFFPGIIPWIQRATS